MKKLRLLVLAIFILLYIYNIGFVFIPFSIRTRMIIGGFGIVAFVIYSKLHITRDMCKIILCNFILIPCSFISMVINQTTDTWFIQYSCLNLIYLLGAYSFLCNKTFRHLDFFGLVRLILYVIVVHNCIAFIGFVNNDIQRYLLSIQTELGGENAMSSILEFKVRAVGLGVGNFFIGGIISGLGLILSVYLYLKKEITTLTFIIIFLLVFITGLFIARTTIIGCIGLLMLINKKNLKKIYGIILLVILVFCLGDDIKLYLSKYVDTRWAFEIFDNFNNNSKTVSHSTDQLKTMYKFPTSIKTWIFGDGLFFSNKGYYMNTDVGYLRVLFGVGLLGLFTFILYQYYLVRLIIKYSGKTRSIGFFLFVVELYLILLNFKGFADMNYFLYLILVCLYSKKNNFRTKKENTTI